MPLRALPRNPQTRCTSKQESATRSWAECFTPGVSVTVEFLLRRCPLTQIHNCLPRPHLPCTDDVVSWLLAYRLLDLTATQRHKAIIDKVVPLVQALHDCKAKHTQTLPGATVFLETAGSGCSDIRSKLFAGFSQTPPSILLEVRRSGNLTLTMQILHKVEANLTVWRNEKKICDDKAEEARFSAEAKGVEVMKRAIEAASALASEKLGNATIERAAHNKIYSDRLDQAQKQLNLALVKLNGAPTTTGTPTKGSIRLALSKSAALRDQRAMQMLVIGSSKDDYLEEHAREEAAKNAQVALLEDTHKNDTDSTQRMLEVTISDIRQMCKVEHEVRSCRGYVTAVSISCSVPRNTILVSL